MKKIIFILAVALSLSACVDNAREKQKENEIVTGLKPATKKIEKRKKTQAEINKEMDDAVAKAVKAKKDFAGLYSCKRTHDIYFFNEDGTGFFMAGGGENERTDIRWQKRDTYVAVFFDGATTPTLLTCMDGGFIESSESLGTLWYKKTK